MKGTVILASASPRRRDLLHEHGYEVEVMPSHVEEVMPGFLTAAEITLFNAKRKAQEITLARPDAIVLAADTLVAFQGTVFGKPKDHDEAFAMLSRLSGRTHEVFSGVWLSHAASARQAGFISVSRVRFRKIGATEIAEYLTRVDPLDKAGGYAAQQNEMGLIRSIRGSYTNVVGLPMEVVAEALREFEVFPAG